MNSSIQETFVNSDLSDRVDEERSASVDEEREIRILAVSFLCITSLSERARDSEDDDGIANHHSVEVVEDGSLYL